MPDPIVPNYRDRYARAYRHLAPRPSAYNPMVEQLYLNAAEPKPTTSAAGAILKGLLSGYVGNKLGQAKMDYAESERDRYLKERREEKDYDRKATFADQVGILGMKSALDRGDTMLDPTKREMAPQIRDRVSGVLNLIPKVPQLTEAMRTDPSLANRMLEDAARDPATGVLGVGPVRKVASFGKDSGLYDEASGEVIRQPAETFDYKDRKVDLKDGRQQLEVSLDGGKTWQPQGDPAPRWESQAGGGAGGVKLDVQRFMTEMADDYFTAVNDKTGVEEIPPEQREVRQLLIARAINLAGDPEHPTRNYPEAWELAKDEFRQRGLLPTNPMGPFDPDVVRRPPGRRETGEDLFFDHWADAAAQGRGLFGRANQETAASSATAAAAAPPAPAAAPKPPGLGLAGALGGAPTVQKDAQGWYIPQGGRGGKQYISEGEAATYRKLSLGFGAPQKDAKGWFINKGRGLKEYIPESVARELLIVLPTGEP